MGKVKLGVIGCGLASDILYGPAFEYMEQGELTAIMGSERRAGESLTGTSRRQACLHEFGRNLK